MRRPRVRRVSGDQETNVRRDGSHPSAGGDQTASLPAAPTGQSRRLIRNGLLAGLTLGVLAGAMWTMIRGRKQWSLRRIGGFAAAGMALGITIAILTPDQFVSTAVLRTTEGDKLPAALQGAFTNASLEDVIRKYTLYPAERNAKAVGRMRSAIRVQEVKSTELGGTDKAALAFTVSFVYPDRSSAGRDARLIADQRQPARGSTRPGQRAAGRSSPNRPQMAAFSCSPACCSAWRRVPAHTLASKYLIWFGELVDDGIEPRPLRTQRSPS